MWVIIIIVVILVIIVTNQSKKEKYIASNNRFKYPNFENALKREYGADLKLLVDDGRMITYQIPTHFSGKLVGVTYFSLVFGNPLNYVQIRYLGYDKTVVCSTGKHIPQGDRPVQVYTNALIDCIEEVTTDIRWIRSTSGMTF